MCEWSKKFNKKFGATELGEIHRTKDLRAVKSEAVKAVEVAIHSLLIDC